MSLRPPPRLDRTPATSTTYGRVYRASLRPTVITLGIFVGIWTGLWAVELFEDIGIDKQYGTPKLAVFEIALGSLYISVTGISVLGIIAACFQRVALARIYTWLSLLGSLLIVVAGFMRVIVHFILKHDLIDECTKIVSQTGVDFRFGIWGTPVHDDLDPAEAANFCSSAWSNDSSSEIISLIIEMILAGFIVSMAFAYCNQLLSNSSLPSTSRKPNHPSAQFQGEFPEHYNPPYLGYDGSASRGAVGGERSYSPPPGPPPNFKSSFDGEDDLKLPGYNVGEYYTSGAGKDHDGKDDPFDDFEADRKSGHHGDSKDSLA